MNKESPTNVGASVNAKLRNLAREQGEDFQRVLLRYANERFLFRLSQSRHAEQFILKGAALFTLWTGKPHRATRDLDFLGYGEPSLERLQKIFEDVLAVAVVDDGVSFDVNSLHVEFIREGQAYGGARAEFSANIAKAIVRLQVDVGFGDAITPGAVEANFPALLPGYLVPRLRTYPRETVVAEKLEAMVQLGIANSRMKDFYDLAVLGRDFDFDGTLLVSAIKATFARRGTPLPRTLPIALSNEFALDASKQTQWSGFVRKASIGDANTLSETIDRVRAFAEAPLFDAALGTEAAKLWKRGGPWRTA